MRYVPFRLAPRWSVALAVLSALVAAGCGDVRTLLPAGFRAVQAPAGATLTIQQGDDQTTVAGSPVPNRPAVLVTGSGGAPLADIDVRWEVLSGGGAVAKGTGTTSADGQFRNDWILGGAGPQQLRASILAGADSVHVVFAAVAVGSVALEPVAGDSQGTGPGQPLLDRTVVRVMDPGGNPVPGMMVRWTVEAGGGTLERTRGRTNPQGAEGNSWRLGAGGTQRLRAELEGVASVPPVFFTAQVQAPVATVEVIPTHQSLAPGDSITLRAIVRDGSGNRLNNRIVRWTSSQPALAAVDSITGRVTATAVGGPFAITARSEGVVGTGNVTVRVPPAPVSSWQVLHHAESGGDVTGVWGFAPNNVYLAYLDGLLYRWDGRRLQRFHTIIGGNGEGGATEAFTGVWGSSPSDLWVVGTEGLIEHFDGAVWSRIPHNLTTSSFRGVWGTSASDIFVVGDNGVILHYNGAGWSLQPSGTTERIYSVWGSSPTNVYAVGLNGLILHYNGASWSIIQAGLTSRPLFSVWGTSSTNVYIAGGAGTVFRYNGAVWARETLPTRAAMRAITGTSASNIYAAGDSGIVVRYNGSGWSRVVNPWEQVVGNPTVEVMTAAWAGAGAAFVAGENNAFLRYDGPDWWTITRVAWDAVWANSATDVLTGGSRGIITRWNGARWRGIRPGGYVQQAFSSIWRVPGGPYFAVGPGRIARSADGEAWVDDPGSFPNLVGVWASSAANAYAVGSSGRVLRYNGSTWTNMPNPSGTRLLLAVWGTAPSDVWVGGVGGFLMRWDGSAWSVVNHGQTTLDITGIWGASPNQVFVSTRSNRILEWNGSSWSSALVPLSRPMRAISGTTRDNVYVAGDNAEIGRFDGSAWHRIVTLGSGQLNDISVSPDGHVFAAGLSDAVIHGAP